MNKLSSSGYVKMAYNMLQSMAEEGKENWVSAVQDLLCTRFLAEFQQRLKDCFSQNWHSRLETGESYEVYKTFRVLKSALEKEKYLDVIHNQQIRKTFTRFRLEISQKLTHKRQHMDENAAMLRCPLCNDETEIEVHLFATCG